MGNNKTLENSEIKGDVTIINTNKVAENVKNKAKAKECNTITINDSDLVIYLIEIATSNKNKYNDKLYSAFLKLEDLKILKKDEQKWIKNLINVYDSQIKYPDIDTLKKIKYNALEDKKKIEIIKLFDKNNKLIENMLKKIFSDRILNVFAEENKIKEHLENSFLPLDLIYKIDDFRSGLTQFENDSMVAKSYADVNLYTGIEYIDKLHSKIAPGSIVSVLKNQNSGNFVDASIIYNTLSKEKKNICVITSNWTSKEIISKILVLHSQTLEDEKKLSYAKIYSNKEDINKINEVYCDFRNKYGLNLQIYCNSSLKIFNVESFRNLLKTANQIFEDNTKNSMDMLVIDCIENLRFEEKGTIEGDTGKIVQKYCNLIIREIKMFNNDIEKKPIAIISSNIVSKDIYSIISVEFDVPSATLKNFKLGTNILEKYSDLVIAIAFSSISLQYDGVDIRFMLMKNRNSFAMEEPRVMRMHLDDCIFQDYTMGKDFSDSELCLKNMSEFYSQNFFATSPSVLKKLENK